MKTCFDSTGTANAIEARNVSEQDLHSHLLWPVYAFSLLNGLNNTLLSSEGNALQARPSLSYSHPRAHKNRTMALRTVARKPTVSFFVLAVAVFVLDLALSTPAESNKSPATVQIWTLAPTWWVSLASTRCVAVLLTRARSTPLFFSSTPLFSSHHSCVNCKYPSSWCVAKSQSREFFD